jgi:hypothetical protein
MYTKVSNLLYATAATLAADGKEETAKAVLESREIVAQEAAHQLPASASQPAIAAAARNLLAVRGISL